MNQNSKKADQACEILWNNEIAPGYFSMGLKAEPPLTAANAGQFVMVKPADVLTPILRRPFGIAEVISENGEPSGISLIYRVVGQGTDLMSKLKKGQFMDVLGPLGNYFVLPKNPKHIMLIGGGTGIPPLIRLTQQTKAIYGNDCKITVCIGGRGKNDILGVGAFIQLGAEVLVTTDDGSMGAKGLAIDPLKEQMEAGLQPPDGVFACGPVPMLKAICLMCLPKQIYTQISMEARMGCGIGACLGCAVKPMEGEGYLHVCKDGPVFNAGVLNL